MNELQDKFERFIIDRATRPALHFVDRGGVAVWTGAQLAAAVADMRALLARQGVDKGNAVVVETGDTRTFVSAFWAAVSLGAAVVPSPPHSPNRFSGRLGRQADVALTESGAVARCIGGTSPVVSSLRSDPVDLPPSAVIVQFSSGSTRDPRGYVLTASGVASNAEACIDAGHLSEAASSIVSWLPLYHDMGLMTSVILPVVANVPGTIIDLEEFVRRPLNWLTILSHSRATFTVAPPFACELIRKRLPRLNQSVDLSAIRSFVVGGDMIGGSELAAFSNEMARLGLATRAIHPAWGMAENTLVCSVSHCGPEFVKVGDIELVGAGKQALGVTVSYAHNGIGPRELAIESSSLFVGTVRRGCFEARTNGRYVTGDVGAIQDDGSIVIFGRSDDTVIWHGQNIHAGEVEAVASGVDGVVGDTATLIDCRSEGRGIVLVAEVYGRASEELPVLLGRRITQDLGVQIGSVLIEKRGALPRTSSGKVKRTEVRARVLRVVVGEGGADSGS